MPKYHKRAITIGIWNESTTTKAAWFWQALHTEREFSAAYFKAILANDEAAIAEALDIIDMSPDDVELSEKEYTSFSRGFTPSGELEVTSWEGYYVTDPLSSGQVFALLIDSSNNRVYWGPVDGFIEENWSDCQVEYHLGSDPTTLCFSSSTGDVTLSFSRDYNEKTGNIGNSSVKGTVGDIAISAVKTILPLPQPTPPLHTSDGIEASFSKNDGRTFFLSSFAPLPEDNKHFVLSDDWKTYTTMASYAMNAGTIILWLCPPLRRMLNQQLLNLRRFVRDNVNYCLGIEKGYIERTKVDLTVAHETLTTNVEQKLNEKLDGVDYNNETVEQVIERLNLKAYTSTELGDSIKTHVQDTIAADARVIQDDLPPPVDQEADKLLPDWIEKIASDRTELVMLNFGADSPGIDALLMTTMFESHKEFYRSRVVDLEQELKYIEKFIDRASRDIQRWRGEAEDRRRKAEEWEKIGEIEKGKVERDRVRELEKQVEKERSEVEKKEKDRTEKEDHKAEAEKKRDIHEKDIETQKEQWKKHAIDHIK